MSPSALNSQREPNDDMVYPNDGMDKS